MIRRLATRLVLLAVCYLIAAVTQVNHLVYTLVKGHYFSYQVIFYVTLLLLSLAVVPIRRSSERRALWLSLSPAIGYLSGLIAFFLMPLLRGSAELGSLFKIRDLSFSFFVSPFFTCAWLVGFYFIALLIFFDTGGSRRAHIGSPIT